MANKTINLNKIELIPLIEDLSRKFEFPNNFNYAQGFLSDELYLSIINASGFKRLFKIPFLGGLAYLENNNVSESRGHHSLAVGLLAYYYSKINNLNKRDERLWVLSGLMHDIHHLPFSHTMEFALKSEDSSFSLHDYDLKIIFESNANDNSNENIGDIAKGYDIEIENEVFSFVSKDKRPLFYNSSHNLDTLEGITRVFQKSYYKKSSNSLPKKIIEANSNYNISINNDAQDLYDRFWEMKSKAYSLEIYDGKKILFERILSYYLFCLCQNNNLLDKLHHLTDEDFFERFPKLQTTINLLWLWINNNCYSSCQVKESSCEHFRRSLEIRKFKTNTEIEHIDLDDVDSLNKRYEVVNCLSIISFDSNSLDKLEKIIELPINEILNKISNEWEEDEQNGPLGLHTGTY